VQAAVDGRLCGRPPTVEDLPELPFTLGVIEEAMRLYPPAPLLLRQARDDTTVGGYRVPAGARVLVSVYNVHRHPRHWRDPDRFHPDRFGSDRFGDGRPARHRYAYLPFGGGPHLCIGKHFALVESHLLLAAVAQRYELRHVDAGRVVGHAKFTLRPRYGLPMTVHPR
jgi:cytochrome P450